MAVTIGQAGFRGRNDDGNETTATWKANQNVNWNQAPGVNFRVRFLMQNSGSTALNNLVAQLEYTLNNGASTNVTSSSSVVRSFASPNLADAANLTQQLTGGTGTFIGLTGFDEANGQAGGNSLDVPASGNFEVEFCIQIQAADVVNGDVIGLRVTNAGTDFTGTYAQVPAIRVEESIALTTLTAASGAVQSLSGNAKIDRALTTLAGTGAVGTVTAAVVSDITLEISGNQGTASPGDIAKQFTLAASGQGATTAVESVGNTRSFQTTGNLATGAIDSVQAGSAAALSGIPATGAVETYGVQSAFGISLDYATGSIGDISVAPPSSDVTVEASGVNGEGGVGDVPAEILILLQGLGSSGFVGRISGPAPETTPGVGAIKPVSNCGPV